MKILETRRKIVFIIAIVVLAVAIIYGVVNTSSENLNNKYDGLILSTDNGHSEEEVIFVRQRIALTEAAIEAQQGTDDIDLDLYLAVAWDYTVIGDLVGSRETYEEFLRINSINYTAWNNYANILKKMGDIALAEDAYLQALQLRASEEHYRDYIDLIDNYYPDDNRDDDVLAALENAVANLGQTTWLMVTLAEWYVDHGQCEKAFNHYSVAKTLSPDITDIEVDLQLARETCVEK